MSDVEGNVEIIEIMLTASHNWGATEREKQTMEKVDSVECVEGKGLRGDRYFDHEKDFLGQVSFIDQATVDAVVKHVGRSDFDPSVLRRNIIVSGIDLNALIGRRFTIGGVEFSGSEECSPCRWMNEVAGDGAEQVMFGRGGLRCRIHNGGMISKGVANFRVLD